MLTWLLFGGHFCPMNKNRMERIMKWPFPPSFLAQMICCRIDILCRTTAARALYSHTNIPIFLIIQVIKFYGWRTSEKNNTLTIEWTDRRTAGINNKQKIMLSNFDWPGTFDMNFCIVRDIKAKCAKVFAFLVFFIFDSSKNVFS